MKGGRASHSGCMCVVGHGYGRLDGGRGEVVDGMHLEQSLREMVACRDE